MQKIASWPLTQIVLQLGQLIYKYLLSGRFLVLFAAWLREVGGNIAEAAFMLATIYVSINFVAHQLILWIIPSANVRIGVDELCSIAFTILPELILIISLAEVWKHVRMIRRGGGKPSFAWMIAYGIPVFFFLVMSVFTLGTAVVTGPNIDTVSLPSWVLIARAMAGFSYCIIQALYKKGDDYGSLFDQLKDECKAALNAVHSVEQRLCQMEQDHQQHIRLLSEKLAIAHEQIEIASQEKQQLLVSMQQQKAQNITASLEGKPIEIVEWLRSIGRTTIDITEVNAKTNISKRKLDSAVKRGAIRPTKNKEIVFVDSLITWIAQEFSITVSSPSAEEEPMLRVVGNA